MSFEFKPAPKVPAQEPQPVQQPEAVAIQSTANQPSKPSRKPKQLKIVKLLNYFKRDKKVKWITISVVAVVLVLLAGYFLVFRPLTAPVRVTKIEMQKSLSSRAEDAPVQQQFKKGEPIMLHFTYDKAKIGSAVKFEVKDSKHKVIRSGSTTVLRADKKSKINGQRFVSVVNGQSTTLPIGKYTIALSVDERTIKTIKFEVIK